jgi:hypothetical protein
VSPWAPPWETGSGPGGHSVKVRQTHNISPLKSVGCTYRRRISRGAGGGLVRGRVRRILQQRPSLLGAFQQSHIDDSTYLRGEVCGRVRRIAGRRRRGRLHRTKFCHHSFTPTGALGSGTKARTAVGDAVGPAVGVAVGSSVGLGVGYCRCTAGVSQRTHLGSMMSW